MKLVTKYSFVSFLFVLLIIFSSFRTAYAAEDISLETSVLEALTMSVSSPSYAFGNLTPKNPLRGSGGIDVIITTSAAEGYNLAISDGVAGTDSALLHTDTITRIPDATALISSPVFWVNGVTRGLGVTVFGATTSKEIKWGTGTAYNDANNKYAGIPEMATTIHHSPGYKADADTTSISFILDVANNQQTGSYSGIITLTATAVLI